MWYYKQLLNIVNVLNTKKVGDWPSNPGPLSTNKFNPQLDFSLR